MLTCGIFFALIEDIDECSLTGMCPNGRCVNEMGTYTCQCDEDFVINRDGTGCIGTLTLKFIKYSLK